MLLQIPCFVFSQTPDLGAAAPFALFTAAGAFNGDVGSSVVGDIGTNIGAFTPPGTIVGQIHVADLVSAQAAADVSTAYGYLSTLTCGGVLGVTLGNGQLLTPNIYCTGAASTLNGALTLDGQGNPNALFIFQIDGAFATNVNSTVTLINGASLCNVYWQVNGHGSTANFAQGTFEFNEANNCAPSATLVNGDGTLRNQVAANALALQLNIWYNLSYNDRDLGIQQLSTLPLCLIDPIVFQEVQSDLTTVQGLLNMSNLYLGNIGGFQPAFGVLLNNSLERLNRFWENCQINDPCTTNVSVAGNFKTEAQDGLEFGHIALEGSHLGSTLPGLFEASDAKGQFEFSNALPISSNYSLLPNSVNMAYANGVTTYDLVLISMHILGIEPLNSPYKMIAADANNSGSITSFDILELRKLILGVYETLPGTASWRFVDNAFVFPNLDNPFVTTFPESKTLLSIQSNEMANDFVAVKIGDVNGSAMANSLMGILERNTATMLFDLEERQVTTGETFEVKMTADQLVQGYQFTLNMDGLEVLEIVGQDMNRSNFAVFNADNALTVSWDSPEATVSSLSSFILTFRATKAGKLSEMLGMSSRITTAVAYGKSTGVAYHPLEVALRFNAPAGTTVSGVGFELYQNIPNPFVTQTLIGFHLPEAASATLRVYDEVGKLVHEQQGDFAKGYNAFAIDANLVISQGTGILYYNLETAKYTATRKMIQAK